MEKEANWRGRGGISDGFQFVTPLEGLRHPMAEQFGSNFRGNTPKESDEKLRLRIVEFATTTPTPTSPLALLHGLTEFRRPATARR